MTTQEQQDWNDSLVAVFAEPHPEIREVRGELVFVRDLGKRCPWCGHDMTVEQFHVFQREVEVFAAQDLGVQFVDDQAVPAGWAA
jgi:hypothetical protein